MRLSTASESEIMALVGYHTRIGSVESSAPEPVLLTLTDTAAPLVSAPLSARVRPDVPSAAMSVLLQVNAADTSAEPVAARLYIATTPTLRWTALPESAAVLIISATSVSTTWPTVTSRSTASCPLV